MKKILFTLLLIAGTFATQAQVQDGDYLRYFRFANVEGSTTQDRGHLFSENFNHCSANLESPGVNVDYTLNRTTGQLYIKTGDEAAVPAGSPFSGRRLRGVITTFDRTDLSQVFITSRRGAVRSEIMGFTVN